MNKSPLAWMGGKSRLAKTITPLIPQHHCYCEVFAGAAWILFKKTPSEVEILNDLNTDLVTLYRVIRYHLEEFVRHLKWLLVARDEYETFLLAEPETLTDIQRAVRFFYIARTSYGSRIGKNPAFSISTSRASNFNLLRVEQDLSDAHLRLARVYIENRPYQQFIERFDRDDVFMYVDPPYWGCEDYYGENMFSREDFASLHELLSAAKCKWMLSINDVPEIRQMFDGYNIREVALDYSVGVRPGEKRKRVGELVIMNY
jgi:DNA adenine methylase